MTKREKLIKEIERLEIELSNYYPGTNNYQMILMDIRMACFSLRRAR